MCDNLDSTVILPGKIKMPRFGLGLWGPRDGLEVSLVVKEAILAGYRMFDTASAYKNEIGVGQGIKESALPREQIFVAGKVWNGDQGYEETIAACLCSLKKLGLDYLDLYLIHWPVCGRTIDTWRAMTELLEKGLVRSIGVCNFSIFQLKALLKVVRIKPMVNQVEVHPFLVQEELRKYCAGEGIVVEAFSPLARGRIRKNPALLKLSAAYGKSPAQLALRWAWQNGLIVIPKSVKPERIRENINIFDFELESKDVAFISKLNRNQSVLRPPFSFDSDGYVLL